jgi:hypothetical protein
LAAATPQSGECFPGISHQKGKGPITPKVVFHLMCKHSRQITGEQVLERLAELQHEINCVEAP